MIQQRVCAHVCFSTVFYCYHTLVKIITYKIIGLKILQRIQGTDFYDIVKITRGNFVKTICYMFADRDGKVLAKHHRSVLYINSVVTTRSR